MLLKRRSFLKFLGIVATAPLSLIPTAAKEASRLGLDRLDRLIYMPDINGYVYCPYIPLTVTKTYRMGKTYSMGSTWTEELDKDLPKIFGV